MKRYIALLRGINVGGKNKLSMAELKKALTEREFSEVLTHLNSGNVIFSSSIDDKQQLAGQIEALIKDNFALDIPVHILLQSELAELLTSAPDWWGTDDQTIYDNLIFLLPPLSYETLYQVLGEPKEAYEQIQPAQNAVFWSFSRKNYQKTHWWAKTANTKIKNKITIRTANTIRKIVTM
ncbi:DUF1697 domain-containing protein [Vagococcus sp. BWB3-3]|uniref:DUF1697 domain-containing protein n=1 Tax=Vagococcus allomyrinae TaxID=2794353 RepID=A0A940SRL0_9ENTE|nr:DUF1697 domain-containing protein [Vagococcus allomyrinae]MBP1040947.1 DUF1697 domain-containing protein [Vagococcus allomyrinae]